VTATVLVVDDSLVVRAVVRAALEEEGYRVAEAMDGADGVERCRQDPPDVVLLDIEMAGLDGHQVLALLKNDERVRDIPVVFLTGRTDMEDVVAGLRGGAHDYLRKPFEPEELLARVGAAVHVKQLQDQLRQRNAELEQVSNTDQLTGLSNRRHLETRLTAAGQDDVLAVVLFDIDHFKRVNDTYGHAVGDLVLREFTHRLRGQLRGEDIACRWGGEEFLVLLRGTDLVGATRFADRVRRAVAAEPMAVGGLRIPVTVSGGCALGSSDAIDRIISEADGRLYEAKNSGRDRIIPAPSRP
jgi:diguanylate cyclase (GGDEF)-like protein